MDVQHELWVQPADDAERRAFETVLHDFVAAESSKPLTESSSVFARYDASSGRWVLSFETEAALEAFATLWREHGPSAPFAA